MLVAFSFRAKPGKEQEFETLMNNAAAGRKFAEALGASRNTLFLGGGRMIRVLEFPEGARPVPIADLADRDPEAKAFFRKLGPLIEDGFEIEEPGTLEAFNRRSTFVPAYDVRL